nr:helix-turn-helix transcriptional regulator [Stutzerimonas stutzeri]
MGISNRLKVVLDTLGLKISEASEKTGVPYRSWQNYLSGAREPKAEALTLICTRLGVSSDWLLTGEGPMRRGEVGRAAPASAESPREQALLALWRELDEDAQREIQLAAEEKKRLKTLEQRLQELEAVVAAGKRLA